MRAFRSLPVGGADEDFAVAFALLTMKFVDRHGATVFRGGKNSSAHCRCNWHEVGNVLVVMKPTVGLVLAFVVTTHLASAQVAPRNATPWTRA